jgi:hypothetical protein
MTISQILWAKSHDWFVSVDESGRGVVVIDRACDRFGGQCYEFDRYFFDYQALRIWAGY